MIENAEVAFFAEARGKMNAIAVKFTQAYSIRW